MIAKGLFERLAHEKFVASKKINIAMMKYAMELLDEEDEEEKKRKQREAEKSAKSIKDRDGVLGLLTGIDGRQGRAILIQVLIFFIMLFLWIQYRDDVYGYFLFGNNRLKPSSKH